MAQPLKILFFDVETAPLLSFVWRPTQDWIPPEMIIDDYFLLTWAAKWREDDKIYSMRLTSREAKKGDDKRIVEGLAEMIREADIVVAHNINRFDIPRVNTRLALLGIEPLDPVRTIDTLPLARKNFSFAHNKLDYLAEKFGYGNKMDTDFELWEGAYHGEVKALKYMAEYNRQDVVLLQDVFEAMLPYARGVPRLVRAEYEREHACPFCGSHDLQKRGFYETNASVFQRWQCNVCKKYSRSWKSEKKEKLGTHPL